MPDFAGLARSLIKSVAAPLTDSFASDVIWIHVTSQDGKGGDNEAAPVTVRALVDRNIKAGYTEGGVLAQIDAELTFVTPLTGVDGRDTFTLPGGFTAPIVKTGGFLDPVTNEAFVTSVSLGTIVRGQ